MPPIKRKICSCKNHDEYHTDDTFTVYSLKAKKIKRAAVDALIDNGDIYANSANLCTQCADYAVKHLIDSPPNYMDFFQDFITAIKTNALSKEQLSQIAEALGRSQTKDVNDDVLATTKFYASCENLKDLNVDEWVSQRNGIVLAFLKGITSSTNTGTIANCVEQIYYARNNTFVGPLSFSRNLTAYYITNSKTNCKIIGSSSAGGSYSTITNWVNDHSKEKNQCPPDVDTVTFFDNNQVLGRKWRVQLDAKCKLSVVTSVMHIFLPEPTYLQWEENLCPKMWLDFSEEIKEGILDMVKIREDQYLPIFRQYRDNFIRSRLNEVFSQQTVTGDHIDDSSLKKPDHIAAESRYEAIPSNHPDKPAVVVIGEPCFENPCSYESIEKVFEHILDVTEVGNGRKWTILGCDGLPYNLGSRLIEWTYICPVCSEEYEDDGDFQQHIVLLGITPPK